MERRVIQQRRTSDDDSLGGLPTGPSNGTSVSPIDRPVDRAQEGRTHTLHRVDGVREYPLDSEALLFNTRMQSLHHVNESAYHVWRTCEGRSIADLAEDLTRTYDVASETAVMQVTRIVETLGAAGLLSEEPGHAD